MRSTGDRLDEERRAAARQVLGALTGLVPVGVVVADPDGLVWYASQRWMDLSGVIDQGLRGLPWYSPVHPDDRDEIARRWRSTPDRHGRLGEFRMALPDGSVRHCHADSVAMMGRDGVLDGYLVVVSDAAAAADADDAAARGGVPILSTPHLLDVVLDRSPDITLILNADGSWR